MHRGRKKPNTSSSFVSAWTRKKHHQSRTGPGQPSQPSQLSPQPLSRRAKMHHSLLILAAPERRSGPAVRSHVLRYRPLARCSTVWKHNAGILMDRTACPLSPMAIYTPHTHTHGRAHTYAQARRHRQTLCTLSKPEIFFPSGDQTRPLQVCKTGPWLLAVGAGWWHVWREAGSSSQYEPIQRQWARDRSACLYVPLLCKLIGTRPTSAHKIQRGFLSFFLSFFLDTVACASSSPAEL